MDTVDVLVIGGGPAGLSAAATAAGLGLACLLVDEQEEPGGQIYRSIELNAAVASEADRHTLGEEYFVGKAVVARFRSSGAGYAPRHRVWFADPDGTVAMSGPDSSWRVRARNIVICTGAMERPNPIKGWTLPGVLTAGGAQVLLKASRTFPESAVLAGSGPLLFQAAVQLARAGTRIAGLLDTTPLSNYAAPTRVPLATLANPRYLLKGVALVAELIRRRVPIASGVEEMELIGRDRAEGLQYRTRGGAFREISAEVVLLHSGIVPQTGFTEALGCDHSWDPVQEYWHPVRDEWGATSVPGIWVAGDSGGISGARAAEALGALAAIGCALKMGVLDRPLAEKRAAQHRVLLRVERRGRRFVDLLFRPGRIALKDETTVCRCECISAGEIRALVRDGAVGPTQVKAFSRAGMGPCQGRMCGASVVGIIAEELGVDRETIPRLRARYPAKPVALGDIASLLD